MRIVSTGFIILLVILISGCKNDGNKLKSNASDTEQSDLLMEEGKEIAYNTFIALSGELQQAMKSGGFEHALSYCNINAMPITDSLSSVYNVDIKRTSLKYRNPKNRPTSKEESILKDYESKKNIAGALTPRMKIENGKDVFYAPIIVQDMCLKCHGSKDDIKDYQFIKKLYPEDLAHDYRQGDIRGMWSITFLNNNKKSNK